MNRYFIPVRLRRVATLAVVLFSWILYPAAVHSEAKSEPATIAAQKAIDELKSQIVHRHIASWEVIYCPVDIETIVGLSPSQLDSAYVDRLIVREPVRAYFGDGYKVLNGMQFSSPVKGYGDFRWGCKYYDGNHHLVCSIYVDRWGRNAEINGNLVSLHGKFYGWLQSKIAPRLDHLYF